MTGEFQGVDDLINWLCWCWATDGERFYPPDGTAQECLENIEKANDETAQAWEKGYHARAYTEAMERFEDLKARGFDPVGRTEKRLEQVRDRGLNIQDIDCEWWKAARDQEE